MSSSFKTDVGNKSFDLDAIKNAVKAGAVIVDVRGNTSAELRSDSKVMFIMCL